MVASDDNLDELPMVKSSFSRTLSAAQLYEMYVVSAESLIEMTSIRPFEELLAEGMLVEFDDMKWNAMFVSHQWAGVGHPDPHMEQFKVLQQALKNVLSGKTAIHANINIELYVGQRHAMTAEDFMEKPLYIWYDYFSCPQAACELAHRQMAILSIPAYVERCRYFTVLCPHVRHVTKDTLLSRKSWASRGWCRLERVCKELSVHDEACDTIEIQSGQQQALAANFDWVKEPVGEGFFTLEKDRMRIAPVLKAMLRNKISSYLGKKDYHNYRLMLNLQNRHFTGLPIKPDYDFVPGFQSEARDPAEHLMAQFMHQNCFTGILDRNEKGWTPLCYAALVGDPLLVYSLLQEKADPNDAIAEPEPLCQFAARTSALHMCAFLKRNESLRILIASGADANHADGYGANALHWAAVADNAEGIQILYDAGLGCHVPNMLGYSPFAMACAGGGVEAIQELMAYASREELAEGLHAALLHGGASAKVVSLLVAAGVDVNHQLTKPLLSPLGVLFACLGLRHRWSQSRLSTYAYHYSGATPLMACLLTSSFESAAVLIQAGARLDLVNYRKKTAADLAGELHSTPNFLADALRGDVDASKTCKLLVKEFSISSRLSL
ncbi:secG [Symbiodinium sp. CCMP2592]|nr:secG [Symbiodinium sp. CCMP2592]